MRAGLTASAVAHFALIAVVVIGFKGAKPFEPHEIESISVDLVPVEAFSNIRQGVETSKIVETETPSIVDTQQEAKLAQPTGNTEKDQPTPLEAEKATPAPTVQTAPAPQSRPADQTAPEPEPAPAPADVPADTTPAAPEPKPQTQPEPAPAPEPVVQAVPDTPEEPQQVAPHPVMKTAAVEKARAEYRRQQREEAAKAAEAKRQQQEKAKPADRISDIINAEKSRGATTGSGGQATAGKTTGTAARLTQSERDALAAAMRQCFAPPMAAMSEPGLTVDIFVNLNRDGSVSGTPAIKTQPTSQLMDATARAAQRAVIMCGPYTMLAPEKYSEWRQVEVTFDPRQAL